MRGRWHGDAQYQSFRNSKTLWQDVATGMSHPGWSQRLSARAKHLWMQPILIFYPTAHCALALWCRQASESMQSRKHPEGSDTAAAQPTHRSCSPLRSGGCNREFPACSAVLVGMRGGLLRVSAASGCGAADLRGACSAPGDSEISDVAAGEAQVCACREVSAFKGPPASGSVPSTTRAVQPEMDTAVFCSLVNIDDGRGSLLKLEVSVLALACNTALSKHAAARAHACDSNGTLPRKYMVPSIARCAALTICTHVRRTAPMQRCCIQPDQCVTLCSVLPMYCWQRTPASPSTTDRAQASSA